MTRTKTTLLTTLAALIAIASTASAGIPWAPIDSSADRFEPVLNGEAILDHETGLIWQQDVPDPIVGSTWAGAMFSCAERQIGGRYGWRLPTVTELASLIEHPPGPFYMRGATISRAAGFDGVNSAGRYYWTSTLVHDYDGANPERAYVVHFSSANYDHVTAKRRMRPYQEHALTWCVRGDASSQ